MTATCNHCGSACEEPIRLIERPGQPVEVVCCYCLALFLWDEGIIEAELEECEGK